MTDGMWTTLGGEMHDFQNLLTLRDKPNDIESPDLQNRMSSRV